MEQFGWLKFNRVARRSSSIGEIGGLQHPQMYGLLLGAHCWFDLSDLFIVIKAIEIMAIAKVTALILNSIVPNSLKRSHLE